MKIPYILALSSQKLNIMWPFLFIWLVLPYASPGQSFDDFKKQYNQNLQQYINNFDNGVAKSQQAYENYREAYEKEYEAFKKKMIAKWGDFKPRTKKKWVEYKDGGNERISTDFKAGKGKVEVLADSKEEAAKAQKEMPEKLSMAFKTKGTRDGFKSKDLPNKTITKEPVLENQLNKKKEETVDEYAEKVAKKRTTTKKVTGGDGKTRYVVYVDFDLAGDYLRKRAQKVSGDVYKYAKQYDLDAALVFAIIHVESYFNPTAASGANAYGLMQLVPTTGGRDAYRSIYHKDGIPTKEYLFNPSNNIQMGCTFIHILDTRYFEGVKKQKTREYMMISAYNTGAGNVAKAYTGNMHLNPAIRQANGMKDNKNYTYLRKNLEYDEARNYLKKVTEKRRMYAKWKRRKTQ